MEGKQKFVCIRYLLVIFISTLLFWKRLPILPVLVVVKTNALQYSSNVKWSSNLGHSVSVAW